MAAIPATFKAFQYVNHGANPLDEIKLNPSVAQKPLESTQIRIKVLSAAVNPVDFKLVPFGPYILPKTASKESPLTAGLDLAGVVVEVGSGDVKGFKVGDEVFAMAGLENFGSFAEYINLDVKYAASKPASLSFDEAAGIPVAAQTSYQALVTFGKVQKGQRVLILGGSSGTGVNAIQMAKALGAHVITTTSFRNTELVKSLGADETIDYTKEKWSEVVAPGSIDLIYDCGVEPESWNDEAQKVIKPKAGAFSTIGHIANAMESPIGATLHQVVAQSSNECLLEVTKFIDAGQLKVIIDSVHPFDKSLEAIERQMSNRARGKIIIHIADN